MTSEEKFEYWLEAAEYDLITADAMQQTGRWLYVVFMCQQAIEKLVKGLYTLYVDDDVPRTHNIVSIIGKFSDKLKVKIAENDLLFYDKLTAHYIEKRYPSFRAKLGSDLNEDIAHNILQETKEAFKWLLTLKP